MIEPANDPIASGDGLSALDMNELNRRPVAASAPPRRNFH
jgi:hypothetical protein